MKYLSIILLLLLFGCTHGTFVEVSETKEIFKLSADYKPANTKYIDEYLNNYLRPISTNGLILESHPGHLRIVVDKTVNTPATINQVRTICKGINFH